MYIFSTKPFTARCVECKHSIPDDSSAWTMMCMHPKVNAKDPYSLGTAKIRGTSCTDERGDSSWFFSTCGIKGKLWEPITVG